jgi:hypothetical protein
MMQTALTFLSTVFAENEHILMAYTGTQSIISGNPYATASVTYTADIAYTTTYKGGLNVDGNPSETYGAKFYGDGTVRVDLEFFQWYKYSAVVHANGFNIEPYVQQIWWTTPYGSTDVQGMNYGARAWYNVRAGDVATKFIENMKVCGDSFYDIYDQHRTLQANCGYVTENESIT